MQPWFFKLHGSFFTCMLFEFLMFLKTKIIDLQSYEVHTSTHTNTEENIFSQHLASGNACKTLEKCTILKRYDKNLPRYPGYCLETQYGN